MTNMLILYIRHVSTHAPKCTERCVCILHTHLSILVKMIMYSASPKVIFIVHQHLAHQGQRLS